MNTLDVVPDDNMVTAGVMSYYNPIYDYARVGCNTISLISALTFIITSIMIIIKKSKVSKKLKMVLIISIICLILSRIGFLLVDYLKYI